MADSFRITTAAEIGDAMRNIKWIWDKRKTKTGIEAISLQEMLHVIVGILKDVLEGRIQSEKWMEVTN